MARDPSWSAPGLTEFLPVSSSAPWCSPRPPSAGGSLARFDLLLHVRPWRRRSSFSGKTLRRRGGLVRRMVLSVPAGASRLALWMGGACGNAGHGGCGASPQKHGGASFRLTPCRGVRPSGHCVAPGIRNGAEALRGDRPGGCDAPEGLRRRRALGRVRAGAGRPCREFPDRVPSIVAGQALGLSGRRRSASPFCFLCPPLPERHLLQVRDLGGMTAVSGGSSRGVAAGALGGLRLGLRGARGCSGGWFWRGDFAGSLSTVRFSEAVRWRFLSWGGCEAAMAATRSTRGLVAFWRYSSERWLGIFCQRISLLAPYFRTLRSGAACGDGGI